MPRLPHGPAPFESYFREINQTSLLDPEEERELARAVGEGDSWARDEMVRANLRLVVSIARGYQGKGVCLEDLIAEGNLGLMHAVEKFDPALGVRFSTYASYWIKQSLKRAVINTGTSIRLPAYANELLVKWRRAAARLKEELGREPTPEEVAGRLKLSQRRFAIVQKALAICDAGMQTDGDDLGRPLDECIGDDRTKSPDTLLQGADELKQILSLLDRLEQRDAAVLRLRFGLSGEEPMTLKDIGERLGLTRERVRQIEKEALARLRNELEAA